MAVTITGSQLTIEDIEAVARRRAPVELHPDARERIVRCRAFLARRIEAREIMYGVNTGIGEFSEVVLTDEQVREFQRYLIYNHAAGIGEPCPEDWVRAAMVLRVNVHARGHSGCRPEITETLIAMLNAGVTPVVCRKGSVGACGDLAPMSQIALLMMGEGEAFFRGERMGGAAELEAAGIPVPGLQARDGLATINGSNLTNAVGCLAVLTMMIGAYLLVDGIFGAVLAFHVRPEKGWGWMLFSAAMSFLLGILLLKEWPLSGLWAIGTLVGINLLFAGFSMISIGSAARKMIKRIE